MPDTAIRVRFAPSPTGLLHVGNARTALYNWLFARQKGGAFLVRIEDTDVARSETRHEEQLLEDLQWLGLNWDEGPGRPPQDYGSWRQSDRLAVYHEHALKLLAEGKAYRCFCTPEQLESERALAAAEHRPQVYSGRCRQLTAAESAGRADAGEPFAIRLRIPDEPIHFHDIVHGEITFQAHDVSDPVLVRSGAKPGELGMPVYNFVVVVDDMLMRITHVIRGDDHLSNTPKQVAMYRAFGWTPPEFAHLSTILGADRARLSKRHGATSISTFREMGYLPEALVNYLALLGWAPHGGDREIFSPAELVREFSLERVTASPAVFDFDKLNWLNRHYLKEAGLARIAPLALPFFVARGWMPATISGRDDEWFRALLMLLLPAVDSLQELPEKASLFFAYDAPTAKHAAENAELLAAPSASTVLTQFATILDTNPAHITAERFKAIMNEIKAATGVKGKDLFHPIRIALTGSAHGPEFDKLIPLIEEGAQLGLPMPIHSVHARVAAFLAA